MTTPRRSMRRFSQSERHGGILAQLRRDGTVRIATLAEMFAVTTETVRRDLDELARRGALKRTYGGGAGRSLTEEPGIGIRGQAQAAERARIATAAAAAIGEGDALMIDSGSTTSLFAQALSVRDLSLTIVTNCLPVARALGESPRCRVILCPGDYVAREGGVYGAEAVDFIRRFNANKAILGAGGLTVDGATDADTRSCAIKRAMIERTERAILLLDSAKFGAVQFERVCPLAGIDELVTDASPPRRLADSLRRAGVHIVTA